MSSLSATREAPTSSSSAPTRRGGQTPPHACPLPAPARTPGAQTAPLRPHPPQRPAASRPRSPPAGDSVNPARGGRCRPEPRPRRRARTPPRLPTERRYLRHSAPNDSRPPTPRRHPPSAARPRPANPPPALTRRRAAAGDSPPAQGALDGWIRLARGLAGRGRPLRVRVETRAARGLPAHHRPTTRASRCASPPVRGLRAGATPRSGGRPGPARQRRLRPPSRARSREAGRPLGAGAVGRPGAARGEGAARALSQPAYRRRGPVAP